MSPLEKTETDKPLGELPQNALAPRAADWLWHPWYAKLWWVAIPIYWLPAGRPFGIDFLADFYTSGVGAYLNIVFLPVTALVVLGFGYVRKLRESGYWVEMTDNERNRASAFYRRAPYSPPAHADPISPLYGSISYENAESRARHRGH